MHAIEHGERVLTELDHVRLKGLERQPGAGALPEALAALLDSQELVPSAEVPPDVVTMNARFELMDLDTCERRPLALCYPRDAEPAQGRVSVLSPLGTALLGQRTGAVVHWTLPGGEARTALVAALHYQPEASGDLTT